MLCPICNIALRRITQHGVETDYCTNCRGVWLDQGELDKIIRRVMALAMPFPATTQSYELPLPTSQTFSSQFSLEA